MGDKRVPVGVELVRRGIINEQDISVALDYQRDHPNKKLIDIIYNLELCDKTELINALGEILNEKPILLTYDLVTINITDYISMEIARKNKAIPFDIHGNKIKVCFANTLNRSAIESIKLILLNKGLVMEKYITFEKNIDDILDLIESKREQKIEADGDTTGIVDSIIKNAMKNRASDIHVEPLENEVRVRYRIDGELVTVAKISKDKQTQIIGRIKAISNMFQEKQESQDGRIVDYPEYNIRVSSQKNIYGEKFVLRLLKKDSTIKGLKELGFSGDYKDIKSYFNKKNSITIVAAPTGEGKTTTLYSIIDYLNRPEVNITTIEDPVEIRIPGLNQIEINEKLRFDESLRTVLRQDPDIVLVGEIRDKETAEIAFQAGQTGHYVLSTIHTTDCVEVITRLKKMGISEYDIASTIGTIVSQRLVRKICPHCAKKRPYTDEEKAVISSILKKYDIDVNFDEKFTYTTVGCRECNNTGFYDRIGIFEAVLLNDNIKDCIVKNSSSIDIRKVAMENGYVPLIIDGINKVLDGITTLEELDKKLVIF